MTEKPLIKYSDKELEDALSTNVRRGVVFNYNDVALEMERRKQQRNADKIYKLSILAIIISVASLIASFLTALLK
jgi:hypothetical protein